MSVPRRKHTSTGPNANIANAFSHPHALSTVGINRIVNNVNKKPKLVCNVNASKSQL